MLDVAGLSRPARPFPKWGPRPHPSSTRPAKSFGLAGLAGLVDFETREGWSGLNRRCRAPDEKAVSSLEIGTLSHFPV